MKFLIALATTLLLSACNPSIVRIDSSAITSAHVRTAYVPRFEGSPEYVEESTDYFISNLQSGASVKIIQGDALRAEGPDIATGGNLAPNAIAIAAAKAAGAQVVIMGKVTSYASGGSLNGFSTVRLINVADGQAIATFHRPSGLLVGSEHSAVLAAVKRTAEDVADALKASP